MRMKKLLAWFMVCCLLGCSGAQALDGALSVQVTGQIQSAASLSKEGLAIVNQLLGRLKLTMEVFPDGERAALWIDGRNMWQVERRRTETETKVIFSGIHAYITAREEKDALEILSGIEGSPLPEGVDTAIEQLLTGEENENRIIRMATGQNQRWTIQPEIEKQGNVLAGTWSIRFLVKEKVQLKAALQLKITQRQENKSPDGYDEVSLAGLSLQEQHNALAYERLVLMRAVKYLMDDLSEEERRLITHELRTDNWMDGPAVPVWEEETDQWLVEEDVQ